MTNSFRVFRLPLHIYQKRTKHCFTTLSSFLVDYTTKSSTLLEVSSRKTIISQKSNTGNTVNTLKKEEILKIQQELERWYSILTPEYNRWRAGGYLDSFILSTEWVKTKGEGELDWG